MKRKDIRTIQERADDLNKVLTFSIMSTIKKYYSSVDEFKKEYNSIKSGNPIVKEVETDDGKKVKRSSQVVFCSIFKHTRDEYRKIIGRDNNGKWISIDDIIPYLPKWLHYQKHFSKNYMKSGKSYHIHSYWYIDFDVIERWWNYEDVYDTNSSFYTKNQHILIDKLILKFEKKDKGTKMTKKQKKEIYDKEYAEGKHMLTWDQYQKDEAKKKRSDEKRKLTIAKKAARQVNKEYDKLVMENEQLKAEIEHLKSLKDKNSDISVEENHLIEYNELDKYFPDGMEPEDLDKCSEDCKKRINQEAVEEQERIAKSDENFDYEQQISGLNDLIESGDLEDTQENNAPAIDNSDIDESDALVFSTNNSQKIIDIAFEFFKTNENVINYIKNNKLIPIDQELRYFYLNTEECKYVINTKTNKLLKLKHNMSGWFFETPGGVTRYINKTEINEMKDKYDDKYFYADGFMRYIKNNYSDKFNELAKKIKESTGINEDWKRL